MQKEILCWLFVIDSCEDVILEICEQIDISIMGMKNLISPLYGTLSVWIADRVHFLFLTLDLSQLGWLLLTEKTSKLIKTLNLQLSLADDDDILSFVCLGLKNVAVGVSEISFS